MALKPYHARYTLHDGTRGVLPALAPCSCDAVITAMDTFGERLRAVSVKPAGAAECRRPHPIPNHHPTREAFMSDDLPRPTAPLASVGNVRPIPFSVPGTAERRRLREEREHVALLEAARIEKIVATERVFAHEQGLTDGYAQGWRWGLVFGVVLGFALGAIVV